MRWFDTMVIPARRSTPPTPADVDELRLRPGQRRADHGYVQYISPVKGVQDVLLAEAAIDCRQPGRRTRCIFPTDGRRRSTALHSPGAELDRRAEEQEFDDRASPTITGG